MTVYLGNKQIDAIYQISVFDELPKYFSRTLDSTLEAEDLQGLKNIKDYAFYNQDNLRYVTLPETVESIGNYAFSGCDNIKYGYLRFLSATPPKVGQYSALPTGGGMRWYIPQGSLEAYENDEYFSQYTSYLREYGVWLKWQFI